MNNVRRCILDLDDYVVEQEADVKLNQNESPYDVPEDLKRTIMGKVEAACWNQYPRIKPVRLLEALSVYTGHPSSGILAGVGSSEMIQAAFTAFCEPGDRVVITDPGFNAFARLCRLNGLDIATAPLRKDFSFDVRTILDRSGDARLITLATPNNPTGTSLGPDDIGEIARTFKGTVLVDEAYFEFSGRTALGLLDAHDNIIIMRTLSKAFGLAGLRLGYLLASPGITKELDKARLPFSVGMFQQIAGEVLLENRGKINDVIDNIIQERDSMHSRLEDIGGITPVRSDANFILFGIDGGSAPMVQKALRNKGILIRYFDTGRLANMLRVTIGRPEENEKFISELRRIMEG